MSGAPSLLPTGAPVQGQHSLSTVGPESVNPNLWQYNSQSGSSRALASANRAIFVPLYLTYACVARKLWVVNGSTASGNIDVGVYDYEGTRLVSSGSTAQAGTDDIQEFDITDTALAPGRYYLAVALDGTTGTLTVSRPITSSGPYRLLGICMQDSAFPLPATATFATLTESFVPGVGITVGRVL